MNLESPKITVDKSAENLFHSLTDVNNFEKLMPDTIVKFEVLSNDSFIFGLKGMPEIKLVLKEKIEPNTIVLGTSNDKMPFTLTTNIEKLDDNSSSVKLNFNGEFNPMMAMMIKGPITKFIETLAQNMKNL